MGDAILPEIPDPLSTSYWSADDFEAEESDQGRYLRVVADVLNLGPQASVIARVRFLVSDDMSGKQQVNLTLNQAEAFKEWLEASIAELRERS